MKTSLKRFLSVMLVLAMVITLLPSSLLVASAQAVDTDHKVLTKSGGSVSPETLKAAIMEGYEHLMQRTGQDGMPEPIWYDLHWNTDSWPDGLRPVTSKNADGTWNRVVNDTGNGMYQDSSRTKEQGGIRAMNCTDFVSWMYGYWLGHPTNPENPESGGKYGFQQCPVITENLTKKLISSSFFDGFRFIGYKAFVSYLGLKI